MSDVLELVDVTVARGEHRLLDGISWQANEGERWIVLGPNGAGKTTLLQVAAAHLFPTAGSVTVLGERLGAVDVFELRPRIGLTSAALADRVPKDEKVRDLVLTASYAIVGRWKETYERPDDERADALLRQFGIERLAGRTFGTLSEGERKRVQIARALMPDPELLLLDEPAAGLDLGAREDLVHRLSDLAADPAAPVTVLVTHHVEEIPPAFTHVLMVRAGKEVAAGPLATTLTSANLSATFGVPLSVSSARGRWSARYVSGRSGRGNRSGS